MHKKRTHFYALFGLCQINFHYFPFVSIHFVNFFLVTAGNAPHNHLIFFFFWPSVLLDQFA